MEVVRSILTRYPRLGVCIASIVILGKRRAICRVRFDGEDWIHSYRNGVLVEQAPNGLTPKMAAEMTRDQFCWAYMPTLGDVVVDLGAGVGTEVHEFARLVGKIGRVVCVEAHPTTFRRLAKTTELNGLSQVTLWECAVAATEGRLTIEDSEAHIGNAITRDGGLEISALTLSQILKRSDVRHVDLLKVNIEGYELPVLAQSLALFPRISHLVISCHDFKADRTGEDWMRTLEPVRGLLESNGYLIETRPEDPRPWIRNYLYASSQRPR